jgi:hypothetical protein
MPVSRRRRGFERAGCLPVEQLGLPRARGRELVLAAAWHRVAGEAITRRARAIAIRRGVLEIVFDDERWLDALKSAIPHLAARIARACPELGVRRFRLLRAGCECPDPPVPLPRVDEDGEVREADGPAAPTGPEREMASPASDQADRLASVMERYLGRSSRR